MNLTNSTKCVSSRDRLLYSKDVFDLFLTRKNWSNSLNLVLWNGWRSILSRQMAGQKELIPPLWILCHSFGQDVSEEGLESRHQKACCESRWGWQPWENRRGGQSSVLPFCPCASFVQLLVGCCCPYLLMVSFRLSILSPFSFSLRECGKKQSWVNGGTR